MPCVARVNRKRVGWVSKKVRKMGKIQKPIARNKQIVSTRQKKKKFKKSKKNLRPHKYASADLFFFFISFESQNITSFFLVPLLSKGNFSISNPVHVQGLARNNEIVWQISFSNSIVA